MSVKVGEDDGYGECTDGAIGNFPSAPTRLSSVVSSCSPGSSAGADSHSGSDSAPGGCIDGKCIDLVF